MLTQPSVSFEAPFEDHSVYAAASTFVRGLKRDCHVLVAVSGGSDSLGLLVALDEAATRLARTDVSISAATVDHGLRTQSAAEAAMVAQLCAGRKISHETLVWRGEKPATGLMAAARDARYGLLAGHAGRIGADVIAVAHTLDDQAETFTMRMGRSGAPPVSGMASRTLTLGRIWVDRPFLAVSRRAIRAYLQAKGVNWVDDPSNDNLHYERVRIRRALDGAVAAPAAAADRAGHSRARRSEDAAALLDAAVRIHGAAVAEIDLAALLAEPEAARYLLNMLVAILGGDAHGPGRAALGDALSMAQAPHGARMTAGRCLFERNRGRLFILRERRGLDCITVMPQTAAIWDGRFRIENRCKAPVTVGPVGEHGAADTGMDILPPRLAALAGATRPLLRGDNPSGGAVSGRILAPYARYLPGFDIVLANRLADAFGISPFPSPSYLRTEY